MNARLLIISFGEKLDRKCVAPFSREGWNITEINQAEADQQPLPPTDVILVHSGAEGYDASRHKLEQLRSHDEAFDTLSIAAERAINSGTADEMLDSLEADKAGDFHKLSHGHHEWVRLTDALKNKDAKSLSAKGKL